MALRLAQCKWRNILRMTRMASLRGCCYCAARKQMIIWGCSPQKKLKLWIQALLKKPIKVSWNGLTLICIPAVWKLACYCFYWKSNEDLGLLPSSKNAETLELDSTKKAQKNPERFSEMADPEKSPLWGSTQFLKDVDETVAEMLMKLLLKCWWIYCWKANGNSLPEQALEVPQG